MSVDYDNLVMSCLTVMFIALLGFVILAIPHCSDYELSKMAEHTKRVELMNGCYYERELGVQ